MNKPTPEHYKHILYWAKKAKAVKVGFNVLEDEALKRGVSLSQEEIFFAGAGYLFALTFMMLEEGQEPTDQDMELITQLYSELEEFDQKLRLKMISPASQRPS